MDMRRRVEQYASYAQDQVRQEREQAELDSLQEDLGGEFRLPIGHRIENNLNRDNLEQASIDRQISSNNVGFKLLQKMGWKGRGLGKDEQGIVEPIRPGARDPKLGVGKQEEDDFYTAEENVQRRKLEVEIEETEEIVRKREAEAEREARVKTEVREILRPFFCALCSKQYKTAMEYETHLSSYDHNHKKRFKDMKEQQASGGREDRKKREQLREEREMTRQASIAEAQRLQQQTASQPPAVPEALETKALPKPAQRGALKFGFGSKPGGLGKAGFGGGSKKQKLSNTVSNFFNDEDET